MEKIEEVSLEQWNSINKKNKKMVEEYLSSFFTVTFTILGS